MYIVLYNSVIIMIIIIIVLYATLFVQSTELTFVCVCIYV